MAWLRRLQSLHPGNWLPITGRGLRFFAEGSFEKVLWTLLLTSLISSVGIVAAFRRGWAPVLTEASSRLPDGKLAQQQLEIRAASAVRLGENSLLDLTLDLADTRELGQTADLQISFARDRIHLRGLLGQTALPYPDHIAFWTTTTASTWWAATQWLALLAIGLAAFVFLFCSYLALATLFSPFLAVLGAVVAKPHGLGTAWRLAAAALVPAGMFMTAGVVAYASLWIRLPIFALWFLAHFAAGWIWMLFGVLAGPGRTHKPPSNPFGDGSRSASKKTHPFQTG